MIGKLVFENKWGGEVEESSEVGGEGRKSKSFSGGGDGDNAVFTAGVVKGFGLWTWDYVATIATH